MAIYKSVNSKNALSTHGGMKNCLNYIMNPQKTDSDHCYVIGAYSGDPMDTNAIYNSFIEIKKQYHADNGRQYAHSVISFHKDEVITPEQALSFAIDFAEKTYYGHQVAIAVHYDKEHIHCHMVTNTVSYLDGSKLHKSKNDLQADKDYCNELCREYGFTVAEKGKHFDGSEMEAGDITSWNKDAYNLISDYKKKSYVADCGIAFMTAIRAAHTKEDFITSMQNQGWQVEWKDTRKHITFKNAEGKKVRGSNLVKTFRLPATKELITNELERNREKAERAKENRLSESESIGDGKQDVKIPASCTKRRTKGRGK